MQVSKQWVSSVLAGRTSHLPISRQVVQPPGRVALIASNGLLFPAKNLQKIKTPFDDLS